jgi:hypothetical protein
MEGSRMRISRTFPIAIGLFLALHMGAANATSTTCATSVVCAEFINSSSGVAIHGEANTGIGVRGTSNGSTGFYGATRSGSPFFPGVEGESLNQTGDDVAGAFGLIAASGGAAPAYGILAYGSAYGVYGDADGPGNGTAATPTTIGVFGVDAGGQGGSDTNVGVYGQSAHGTAVLGLANGSTTFAESAFGTQPIGLYADAEKDPNSPSKIAYGVEAVSGSIPIDAYNPALDEEVELAAPNYLIYSSPFYVDTAGNVVANSLATAKGTYVRTTGSSGTTRKSYSARTTMPVMEDFGEGQMVNGRGYVTLDSALSDVIDNRNAYQLFLTPEGDSNGLYVTQKTPRGFMVRDSHDGHSTLAFSYRILAKPVDDDAKRLALAPPLVKSDSIRRRLEKRLGTAQLPLDPFARLQSHLGPAAYARELKAAKKIETGP